MTEAAEQKPQFVTSDDQVTDVVILIGNVVLDYPGITLSNAVDIVEDSIRKGIFKYRKVHPVDGTIEWLVIKPGDNIQFIVVEKATFIRNQEEARRMQIAQAAAQQGGLVLPGGQPIPRGRPRA